MPAAVTKLATTNTASLDALWQQIVRGTMEACLLRKEGRAQEASRLLTNELPGLIKAWSAQTPLSPEQRKDEICRLISRTQEAVEFACVQRQLIVDEVCKRLSNELGSQTPVRRQSPTQKAFHLRRRIPIDDICGMIDSLAESEREAQADNVLPLRRTMPFALNTLSGNRLSA